MPSFTASPNVLFDTRVCAVRRPSPVFVRLTLTGPEAACRAGPSGARRPGSSVPVQLRTTDLLRMRNSAR